MNPSLFCSRTKPQIRNKDWKWMQKDPPTPRGSLSNLPDLMIFFCQFPGRVPLIGIRTNHRGRHWVLDLAVRSTNSNCYCSHASAAPPCWVFPSPAHFHGSVGGSVSVGGWGRPIEPVNIDDFGFQAQYLLHRYGSYPFLLLEQHSLRHSSRLEGIPTLVWPTLALSLLLWARRISFHGGCCSGCVMLSRLTAVDRN